MEKDEGLKPPPNLPLVGGKRLRIKVYLQKVMSELLSEASLLNSYTPEN